MATNYISQMVKGVCKGVCGAVVEVICYSINLDTLISNQINH